MMNNQEISNYEWELVSDKCRKMPRIAANAKDGSILVRIPAGEFEMGDGEDENCPKHRVELSEYWIALYCVTNRQYGRFVAETKHRVPHQADYGTPIWKNSQCPAKALDHPAVCVSWDDCDAYAKWAGLSLPTEAQWEKAARGPGELIYPWGNKWNQTKCRNAHNRGKDTTAVIWDYPQGASGCGTLQQSGNVWEWCADWYEDGYYGKSPVKDPTGPNGGSHRVSRGGSWGFVDALYMRGAYRIRFDPALRAVNLGFRLVRNSSSFTNLTEDEP